MAANTSRIIVDAGGRIFHTTRDTLLMSGAGYFMALFGPTGTALRSLGDADDDDASELEKASGPSTKRSRTDPTEIFIDRNPELFSVVLDFVRSGKLPSKVKRDLDCLDDLTTEAEFFVYDALKKACSEAKTELKKALSEALGSEPKAEYNSIILPWYMPGKIIEAPGRHSQCPEAKCCIWSLQFWREPYRFSGMRQLDMRARPILGGATSNVRMIVMVISNCSRQRTMRRCALPTVA